ncbi:MAG: hypothetical protein ACOCZB_03370, partial [Spirochaetota bacterium]
MTILKDRRGYATIIPEHAVIAHPEAKRRTIKGRSRDGERMRFSARTVERALAYHRDGRVVDLRV